MQSENSVLSNEWNLSFEPSVTKFSFVGCTEPAKYKKNEDIKNEKSKNTIYSTSLLPADWTVCSVDYENREAKSNDAQSNNQATGNTTEKQCPLSQFYSNPMGKKSMGNSLYTLL